MFKHLRLAPKSGGLKYHVTVHVHSFTLAKGGPPLPPNCEELSVLWNRGAKLASTKGVPTSSIDAGVLVFDERLILICTFYRGKGGGAFDEKKAKFILKGGPLGSCEHGRGSDISKVKFDLGKYAQLDEMKSELNLEMEIKSGFLGILNLTITSRWLKEARVLPSDELSNLSSCLGSSEVSGADISDDDLEGPVPDGFPPPLDLNPAALRRAGPAVSRTQSAGTLLSPVKDEEPDAGRPAPPPRRTESGGGRVAGAGVFAADGGPEVAARRQHSPTLPPRPPPARQSYDWPLPPAAAAASTGAARGRGAEGDAGSLRAEVLALREEVAALRAENLAKDRRLHDLHLQELHLREQLRSLKSTTFHIARGMSQMEVELQSADSLVAEETERLTLAYVPVIRALTDELEATKAALQALSRDKPPRR